MNYACTRLAGPPAMDAQIIRVCCRTSDYAVRMGEYGAQALDSARRSRMFPGGQEYGHAITLIEFVIEADVAHGMKYGRDLWFVLCVNDRIREVFFNRFGFVVRFQPADCFLSGHRPNRRAAAQGAPAFAAR